MKGNSENDTTIIEFLPLILREWKKLILYSFAGALLLFLGSFFLLSNKYYTETRIIGEFSKPVETKFGTYRFSSTNLIDYTYNVLDSRILDKTLNDFNSVEKPNKLKIDFKPIDSKDNTSALLSIYTDQEDFPLEDFLSSYFKNFLDFLNLNSYRFFLKEKLTENQIAIDKLNHDILTTSKELQAYKVISDSVKGLYNSLTGFDKESFFSSETLNGVDILSAHSASLKKQLQLALLKIDLESTLSMNDDIEYELNKTDLEESFIPLFNQRIRIVSQPSASEVKSRNKLIFALIGGFIGFFIVLVKLLVAQLKL